MTPYERGFLDCRERAAKVCDAVSITYQTKESSGAAQSCRSQILSLTPEAPAPARGATLDEYELAQLAERFFSDTKSARLTVPRWVDGIDLEVATPGLKELANAIVQRELCSEQEQIAALQKAADDFQMDYRQKCDAETKAQAVEIAALREALKPFANYACEPPCECHNCKARAALAATRKEPEHG